MLLPALQAEDGPAFIIEKSEDGFNVRGKRVIRMVAMTQMDNSEAVRYLHRRLERMGVIEALREHGAQEGDNVRVGDAEFSFTDEQ